jgi:hypothetical protein
MADGWNMAKVTLDGSGEGNWPVPSKCNSVVLHARSGIVDLGLSDGATETMRLWSREKMAVQTHTLQGKTLWFSGGAENDVVEIMYHMGVDG